MWRPLEIFLYDWWPIRTEAQLSDRLATMPVRIRYLNVTSPDAWKADWPVATPVRERSKTERSADADESLKDSPELCLELHVKAPASPM